jgi:hypothetical protein
MILGLLVGIPSIWLFDISADTAIHWIVYPVIILYIPFYIFVLPVLLRLVGIRATRSEIDYWARYCSIIFGVCGMTGIFYGMIGVAIGRLLFGLDENTAMLYVFLPIFILCIPIGVFLAPKHLKKVGIL